MWFLQFLRIRELIDTRKSRTPNMFPSHMLSEIPTEWWVSANTLAWIYIYVNKPKQPVVRLKNLISGWAGKSSWKPFSLYVFLCSHDVCLPRVRFRRHFKYLHNKMLNQKILQFQSARDKKKQHTHTQFPKQTNSVFVRMFDRHCVDATRKTMRMWRINDYIYTCAHIYIYVCNIHFDVGMFFI